MSEKNSKFKIPNSPFKEGFYLSEDGEWVPDGWGYKTLEELDVKLIDCVHNTPKAQDTGFTYIAIPQMKNGRLSQEGARLISQEDFQKWTVKALPQKGDLVVSRRCNPGESAYVTGDFDFALGQNLVLLRCSSNLITPLYLKWLSHTSLWENQVRKYLNVGAVFESLKCAEIPLFKFYLPENEQEQKAIATVLSSLDDKIELLREQNDTLEALAQTLFKRWFIDFNFPDQNGNPYKDSGGKMIPSELGEIPDGWTVTDVKSVLTRLKPPKSYKKEEISSKGVTPVYEQGQSILMGFHNNSPCLDATPQSPIFIFGDHTCITKLIFTSFSLSPNVIPLKGNSLDTVWTYFAIHKLQKFIEYRRHWMELADKKITVPSNKLDLGFSIIVNPIIWKISINEKQIQTLTNLRDTLLPKLMKGEVRIPVEP